MKLIAKLLLILTFFAVLPLQAQEEAKPIREVWRTLKVINSHSTETIWQNGLVFTVGHRFLGTVDLGIKEFYGLDRSSNTRLGLAYGLTNNLMVGIGRSSMDKVYDGYIKYSLLDQKTTGMPVSATFVGSSQIITREWSNLQEEATRTSHRMSYMSQILVARKFNEVFSLQLSPTYVYRNLVTEIDESHGTFALGLAAKFKITQTTSIQTEYFQRINEDELSFRNTYNVLGIAIDFTTPQHSFQLQFTNNVDITEQDFLTDTRSNFFDKGIHFGFNITRKFLL